MTIICRTKTKESGLTITAKLLPRRKGHPNWVRNVSWAVHVPVPVWQAFAHLITRKSKRRDILVSSDEEGDWPETFFKHHHKKLKSLLPKHLPSHPQSFHEYLRRVLDMPNTEIPRWITIHSHFKGYRKSNLRFADHSWLPPSLRVKVGQVAGSEIQHTFPGDVFPQFTHHGKSDYHCELCSPFLRWAK